MNIYDYLSIELSLFIIILVSIFFLNKFKDFFAPTNVFVFTWLTSLILYNLKLFEYPNLSIKTYLIIFWNIVIFIVTGIIFSPKGVNKNKSNTYFDDVGRKEYIINYFEEKKFWKATKFIFICSFIANIIQIVVNYGSNFILIFSLNTTVMRAGRKEYGLPILGNIAYLSAMAFVLGVIYLALYNKRKNKVWCILFFSAFFMLLSMQKTNLLRTLIWAIVSYNFVIKRKINIKTLITIPFIVVLLFYIYNNIFSPYYGGDYRFWIMDGVINLPQFLSFLSVPYSFAASNFPALNEILVNTNIDYSYGLSTLYSITRFINFLPGLELEISRGFGVVYIPIKYNVYTYLWTSYKDFGYIGVIVMPLIYAIMVWIPYYKMSVKKQYEYFLINGIFAWCLFASIFSNHFIYNYMIVYFITSLIVGKYIKR